MEKDDFLDHSVPFTKMRARLARMNGGNNASAYNWRAKLAVHPDWYNNVYPANWDTYAQKIMDRLFRSAGMVFPSITGQS